MNVQRVAEGGAGSTRNAPDALASPARPRSRCPNATRVCVEGWDAMNRWALSGWVLLSLVGLAGCSGSDQGDAGDAASDVAGDIVGTEAGDVARDALIEDAADAAVDALPNDGGMGCTLAHVLVSTTDFVNGGFVRGNATAPYDLATVDPGDAGPVDQNHVVRQGACLTFDLRRTEGVVAVLDPLRPFTPLRTIPLERVAGGPDGGTQTPNPEDIAAISPTKAYVLQYTSARIAIIDPSRDGAAARIGSIDLAPLADSDGVPEMESIVVVGGRAYVTLQQLTNYVAPAHSHVAVIDVATDTLVDVDPAMPGVQAIELSFGNPSSAAATVDGTHLLVAGGGNYGNDRDGALDVIDLATLRVVRSLTPSNLGGEPSSVESVRGTVAWAAVSSPVGDAGTMRSRIVAFDYATGMVQSMPIAESTTVSYGGLRRAPDGVVWAIDAGFGLNGAVFAFDPMTGAQRIVPPFSTPGVNTYSLDFVP